MIKVARGFPASQTPAVAEMFWAAFSDKLGKILGPKELALQFLTPVLRADHALSACAPCGKILGVAGFKTQTGGFVGGQLRDLSRVYGWFGSLWRGILLEQLERELAPEQLLMDGIFVTPEARGQGVGSALLNALKDYAQKNEFHEIRLDVIDTNLQAKALYERQGFIATEEIKTGFLSTIVGFKSATTMTLDLSIKPQTKL